MQRRGGSVLVAMDLRAYVGVVVDFVVRKSHEAFARGEHMKVLFLGNSYTHRGPVPLLVALIAERAGRVFSPYAIAPGGASLRDHLESDEVEYTIRFGGWDALVLQEQSVRPTEALGDPLAFARDARALATEFVEHNPGGAVWLTQTWARHPAHLSMFEDPSMHFYPGSFASPEQMRSELTRGVTSARAELERALPGTSVRVLWLGDAWARVLDGHPELELHDPDGSHASVFGQWLCALSIHRELLGELPDDMDGLGIDARLLAHMR